MGARGGMQPLVASTLMRKITGQRPTENTSGVLGSFEHCIIQQISGDEIYFTRPMYNDKATIHGPVEFHLSGSPAVGDNILIAWVEGPSNHEVLPWVLGWST